MFPVDGPLAPTALEAVLLASAFLAAVLLFLRVRAARHRARLRRIPLRIHVAGVRGKSTVVRLVAAGLRGEGRRVLAKTTGTEPAVVDPDGREVGWFRAGSASVHEQRRFVRRAVHEGADAIVVESMAIRGEYLWASQHLLVDATHAVVTNVRVDHQEVYGDDSQAVARSMAEVVPIGGRLLATDEAWGPSLADRCRRTGTRVDVVPTAGLPHEQANRRLAIAVCEAAGVSAPAAAARMDALPPGATAFSLTPIGEGTTAVRFANAFACNDVASLDLLFREVHPEGTTERDVVFLNARADRPLRTRTFLRYLEASHPRATIFVASPRFVPAPALRRGAGGAALRTLRSRDAREVLRELVAAAGRSGHVWGIGNYHGLGARLTRLLREEASCSPSR